MKIQSYTINKTVYEFDTDTGELTGIVSPQGVLLDRPCRLLDIAWPVAPDYEILRVSPSDKYLSDKKPLFFFNGECLTVTWETLPRNIEYDGGELAGGISATFELKQCDDGVSAAMSCHIVNHSKTPARQVLFPNIDGLVPVAGKDQTRFTTLGVTSYPFRELEDNPVNRNGFFGTTPCVSGAFYTPGGYFDRNAMIGRWYDLGGLNYGASMYRRWWGWGPDCMSEMGRNEQVWLKMNNLTGRLRIAWIHNITVEAGQTYDSGEYVFTPHSSGWAKGIIPYRNYIDENKKRVVPVPDRVRDALGFRTIWIDEQYPADPDSIKYYYRDLPTVGRDMAEHGLYDLCIWGGHDNCLPFGDHSMDKQLGGAEGLRDAVAKLAEIGVSISFFVSYYSLWKNSGERYGLGTGPAEIGWSENLKGVPVFRSPYMKNNCCAVCDQNHPLWQSDVREAFKYIRDSLGIRDISWDQVLLANSTGSLSDILKDYRRETPDAVMSGESTFYFEGDIDFLDYTWDWEYWPGTGDCRPYINAVRTTRPNINVDNNPLYFLYCFMDNVYVNVYPSKPDNTNGSALISEYPEFSETIKKCAKLRKKYLEYFTEGELIGDCVLEKPSDTARVTGYILGKRALIIAVPNPDCRIARLTYNLSEYTGDSRKIVTIRDIDNEIVSNSICDCRGTLEFDTKNGAIAMIEIM